MAVNPLQWMNIQQIAELAKKKWASQSQIQSGYNAIGQQPNIIQQAAQAQQPQQNQQAKQFAQSNPWFANPFASDATGDIAMAGRKAPTVATPQQPVIDRTIQPWGLQYDANNPWDFIKRINARKALGGKLSEDDIYNYQVALEAQQKSQTDMSQNPFADQLAQQNALIEQTQASQMSAREQQIARKQQELDAKYGSLKTAAQDAGRRQQEAGQTATSFSGFGRSTFNADQQVQIEKSTSQALQQLEAAKQMELEAYQAELEGADAETLSAMYSQITQTQLEANKRQLEAIAKTAEINAGMGSSMQEAINNLLSSASQSGMAIWPDDAKNLEIIATSVAGMTPEQRQTYLAQFDETTRALIEWAAAAAGWKWEAAKTQSVGSGKSERVYQRNPETQRYDIPVGWAWFGWGGWWSWGGAWGSTNVPLWPMNADLLSNLYKVARSVANSSVRSSWLIDPDAKLALWYITSNLTLEKITNLKKNWVSLWALSEWEWAALASSIGEIWPGNSKDVALEQLNRMIRNAWGIPLSKEDAKKWVNPIAPTTPNTPTTWAGTTASFDDLWNSL